MGLYTHTHTHTGILFKEKRERGITLIALVVTIIVLMILAGVAISLIAGNNSVMQGAQEASSKYSAGASDEKSLVDKLTNVLSENQAILGDKTAPTVTIDYSDVKVTKFTLTATGEDELGISKYEFYIDGKLYNTVNTSENTVTCNVTDRIKATEYKCKVRVYDVAGNSKDSEELTVTTLDTVTLSVLEVGDFINYDAGVWTEEDLAKITGSTGSPTVHASVRTETADKPTEQGRFGGFILGQSRNTNSITATTAYLGWRVWDKGDDGTVTIISAGNPETFYHADGKATETVNILTKRNYTMYENKYAKENSAKVLTGQEAVRWYNKQYNTSYTMEENTGASSTFFTKKFSEKEPISVFDCGTYYFLATAYNSNAVYIVNSKNHYVGHTYDGSNYTSQSSGIRILITLKPDVLLEQGTGNGDEATPWKIAEE